MKCLFDVVIGNDNFVEFFIDFVILMSFKTNRMKNATSTQSMETSQSFSSNLRLFFPSLRAQFQE